MSLKPVPATPRKFDLQKFEAMVEPFSVRIEKVKGSMKLPIPLPQQEDGGAPGTGWSKDQVREIERWMVNEWAGGGHYNYSIIDSSNPSQIMEWTSYYPPQEFPEKTPPTLVGAIVAAPATTNPQARTMATFPGSGSVLPSASFFPQQPQMPAPQWPYAMPYPMATPVPQAAPVAQTNEVAMLRDALAQAREAAAQRDFERRLAEIKADGDRRFVELQQMMQQLVQQMSATVAQSKAPVVDPAIEQLRESNRMLQEQLRQQAAEVERTRREAELRDQIRASQEATARLVEESNRRFEAFMAANANKGPDPQFMMFQQLMQTQVESTKEIARAAQSQFDRMQNLMMRPQDVLQIAKESSQGADQVAMNLNRQWEQMFSISRQLTEQAAQLNQGGGGNEVIGLVRDAGSKLTEWAEKYTGGKTKENIASMNAQAEIARAQADVIKSQQDRMADMARMEAAMRAGVPVQMPNGTFHGPAGIPQAAIPAGPAVVPLGSNGKPATPPWIPPKTMRTDGSNTSGGLSGAPTSQPDGKVVPIRPEPPTGEPRRIKGRTDAEWFGLIAPQVHLLREAVDLFIEGLKKTPPEKHENSASPTECALAIQQAAMEVMNRQIPILAMSELMIPGRVADFLDVLLPDAPQPYRDDVVKILMGEEPADKDDDKNDDDDDDDDEDGKNEGQAS